MKYLLLIALFLTACKSDCDLTCTFTIENSDGVVTEGTFSKSDELKCELTDSEYKAESMEFLERNYVEPYNAQDGNGHFATLECD